MQLLRLRGPIHRMARLLVATVGCVTAGRDARAPALPSSTMVACDEGGGDSDRDGLTDSCELEMARRFAPTLIVSTRD